MKVKFEHERLQMLPETDDEENFCQTLVRRVEDSKHLLGWYGDMRFDKETSGYIITWEVGRAPSDNVIEVPAEK